MSNKQYEPTYEGQLDKCQDERHALQMQLEEAWDDLAKMKAERDEARRSCCEFAAIVAGADDTAGIESGRFHEIAMQYMRDRGWDCFKEDTK